MFSLKIHTAKYGQWSQHSPPFTSSQNGWSHRRTDVVTLPKQEASIPRYLCLSWPKRRMCPGLDFQGGKSSGSMVTVAHISQHELSALLWLGVRVHGFFRWLPASGSPASLYNMICTVTSFPSLALKYHHSIAWKACWVT